MPNKLPLKLVTKFIEEFIDGLSLSVFSLVPDLLFDCSRLLEYAKIRTVLQSIAPLRDLTITRW